MYISRVQFFWRRLDAFTVTARQCRTARRGQWIVPRSTIFTPEDFEEAAGAKNRK